MVTTCCFGPTAPEDVVVDSLVVSDVELPHAVTSKVMASANAIEACADRVRLLFTGIMELSLCAFRAEPFQITSNNRAATWPSIALLIIVSIAGVSTGLTNSLPSTMCRRTDSVARPTSELQLAVECANTGRGGGVPGLPRSRGDDHSEGRDGPPRDAASRHGGVPASSASKLVTVHTMHSTVGGEVAPVGWRPGLPVLGDFDSVMTDFQEERRAMTVPPGMVRREHLDELCRATREVLPTMSEVLRAHRGFD